MMYGTTRRSMLTGVSCASVIAFAMTFTSPAAGAQDDASEMQKEAMSAESVLSADVRNGVGPVGQVSDLVLSSEGDEIQYVLYNVRYPYRFYGGEDGFSTFEGAEFWRAAGGDLAARFEAEESDRAPERLELTASEADNRLVSRVLDERVQFADDATRRITDMLIDPETGAVTHYVASAASESLLAPGRRVIPADSVSIGDGGNVTAATDVDGSTRIAQQYDRAFL